MIGVIHAPSYEEARQAVEEGPLGVVMMLQRIVDSAVPEPWNHELTKHEYGAYWSALREALDKAAFQAAEITLTTRGQDVKTYAVDHLLDGFAWDLSAVAESSSAGLTGEELERVALRMRAAARGLRNYRAETITDDGKMAIVGHTAGVQEFWPDKMKLPELAMKVTIAEEVAMMSEGMVFHAAYRHCHRAIQHARRERSIVLRPVGAAIELTVRHAVAR